MERISVVWSSAESNGNSRAPSVSADGRYIAFRSEASNLVAADENGVADGFVYDRVDGWIERVSVASDGGEGNQPVVWELGISVNGRFVVFATASALVPEDVGGFSDVYLRDRESRTTERVSVAADGSEAQGHSDRGAHVSADGRFVVFTSSAPGLVEGAAGPAGFGQVYVRDRVQGTTELISRASDGGAPNHSSIAAAMTPDGRFVAFTSNASNLVAGDTNAQQDAFVHDRMTGVTHRVSVASGGVQANGNTSPPVGISDDGRYVAFVSRATNLVAGDTNGFDDVFVHDRETQQTVRVNLGPGGAQANGYAFTPRISGDGRWIAFHTSASNLVADDTNQAIDVFVYDRESGALTRESLTAAGEQGSGVAPALSGDGAVLAFWSAGSDLVANDANIREDVFVRDRVQNALHRIGFGCIAGDANGPSYGGWLSADGRWVLFTSSATNLVADPTGGSRHAYLYDRDEGTTELVSRNMAGAPAALGVESASLSSDGNLVLLTTRSPDLVSGDANGYVDAFVLDRQAGTIERVSVASDGTEANSWTHAASMTADGALVLFVSAASNLVADDTNGKNYELFLRDRAAGTTTRVSRKPDGGEMPAGVSSFGRISADGRWVTFVSNLDYGPGSPAGSWDAYVLDRETGVIQRIRPLDETAPHSSTIAPPHGMLFPMRSALPFPPDPTFYMNFRGILWNRDDGTIAHEFSPPEDSPGQSVLGPWFDPTGSIVVFQALNENFIPDQRWEVDGFAFHPASGTSYRIVRRGGASSFSEAAHHMAFGSFSDSIVAGDRNGLHDSFVAVRPPAQPAPLPVVCRQ